MFSQNFFISLPSSYQLNNSIGTLNSCIFNMSNLQTLHLSGMGFQGSISNSIIISSSLKELSLSHNLFSNIIPNQIQSHKWDNLDLSYNKFGGYLKIKNKETILTLENNRLSGNVPLSLINSKKISVLYGNMFSCYFLNPKLTLPNNDNNIERYSCGSNNFNISLLFYCIIIFLVLLLKSRVWKYEFNNKFDIFINIPPFFNKNLNILRREGNELTKINESLNIELVLKQSVIDEIETLNNNADNIKLKSNISNITTLVQLMDNFSKALFMLIFFNVIMWMSVSLLLNDYYGFNMYKSSYLYSFSTTFLSGVTPSIILFILGFISILVVYYVLDNYKLKYDENKNIENKNNENEIVKYNENLRKLSLFIVLIINIWVMFIVNGLYVYSTFFLNSLKLFFIEIAVAFLKIFWFWQAVPLLTKKIKSIFNCKNSNDETTFQCLISIINNIAIPLCASAILSPNCFNNIFVPSELVISSYSYNECTSFASNVCDEYTSFTYFTSYLPPYSYSYQCSSTIATTYSSIYILMSVMLMINKPIKLLMFSMLSKYFQISNNDKNNENSFHQTVFIVNIVCFLSIAVSIGFIIPAVGISCCLGLYLYIHNTLSTMGERISD
jgi:hypothetical protein